MSEEKPSIEIPLPQTVQDPILGEYQTSIKARETPTGAIVFEDGYEIVYLYPEQVAALRAYLNAND